MIGVPVAVPQPLGEQLQQARLEFGDAQAGGIPTHVTLLPPSEVGGDDLPGIREHLRSVAGTVAPFEIELCGTDTFRPVTPVVFLPLVRGAEGCARLEAGVRSGPLERELDFPYHPHVTVAHNVDDAHLDQAAAGLAGVHESFTVRAFVLYVQREDDSWSPLEEFTLSAS